MKNIKKIIITVLMFISFLSLNSTYANEAEELNSLLNALLGDDMQSLGLDELNQDTSLPSGNENIDLNSAPEQSTQTYTNEAMFSDTVIDNNVSSNQNNDQNNFSVDYGNDFMNQNTVVDNNVTSENNAVTNIEVTKLPQTGPTEIILLLLSILLTGTVYFLRKKSL